MAARILAQIIVAGSQIVGKAFMEAYRQAAANAAKNGGHQAAKNGGGGGSKAATADALTRKSGMSMDEAMNILNITKESDLEKIVKNYQHLYKVNDKAVNGSFYLQSKVVRAKERLEMEWAAQGNPQKIEAEVPEPAPASGSGSGSGSTDATSKTSDAGDAKSPPLN